MENNVHRFCPQCGLEQKPGAEFCPQCLTTLRETPYETKQSAPQQFSQNTANATMLNQLNTVPPQNNLGSTILRFIAAALFIIIGVFNIYWLVDLWGGYTDYLFELTPLDNASYICMMVSYIISIIGSLTLTVTWIIGKNDKLIAGALLFFTLNYIFWILFYILYILSSIIDYAIPCTGEDLFSILLIFIEFVLFASLAVFTFKKFNAKVILFVIVGIAALLSIINIMRLFPAYAEGLSFINFILNMFHYIVTGIAIVIIAFYLFIQYPKPAAATPSYQQPAAPSYQQPAAPSYRQPSYQQPATPSYQQPAAPTGYTDKTQQQ